MTQTMHASAARPVRRAIPSYAAEAPRNLCWDMQVALFRLFRDLSAPAARRRPALRRPLRVAENRVRGQFDTGFGDGRLYPPIRQHGPLGCLLVHIRGAGAAQPVVNDDRMPRRFADPRQKLAQQGEEIAHGGVVKAAVDERVRRSRQVDQGGGGRADPFALGADDALGDPVTAPQVAGVHDEKPPVELILRPAFPQTARANTSPSAAARPAADTGPSVRKSPRVGPSAPGFPAPPAGPCESGSR